MIDALGHLFYATLVVGVYLVGHDRPIGWVLCMLGNLGWVGLGLALGLTSIWIWDVIFIAIDVIGWRACRSRATLSQSNSGEPA